MNRVAVANKHGARNKDSGNPKVQLNSLSRINSTSNKRRAIIAFDKVKSSSLENLTENKVCPEDQLRAGLATPNHDKRPQNDFLAQLTS